MAVDVGNSIAKMTIRISNQLQGHFSASVNDEGWTNDVIEWASTKVESPDQLAWRVASVNQRSSNALSQAIESASMSMTSIGRHDVPMDVQVDHPEKLGIDRLLAGFAAFRRFGGPLICVDTGSAITIDWIDLQGSFHGGAILPGLAMQFNSLARGTEALPKIAASEIGSGPLPLPGSNTADAIRGGVITGIAAAIDRIADQYAQQIEPTDVHFVMTGGDATRISPLLMRPHVIVENLVCQGILDLP